MFAQLHDLNYMELLNKYDILVNEISTSICLSSFVAKLCVVIKGSRQKKLVFWTNWPTLCSIVINILKFHFWLVNNCSNIEGKICSLHIWCKIYDTFAHKKKNMNRVTERVEFFLTCKWNPDLKNRRRKRDIHSVQLVPTILFTSCLQTTWTAIDFL